jgi:uncharacterized protein (DUF58 family)
MMLTRRGYAVVAVVLLGLANAVLYGPRALNAIVAPGVVALAASLVMVRRVPEPEISRRTPEDGFVGERRTVTLSLDATTSFTGRVLDLVPEDLAAEGNDRLTTVGDADIEYELTYARRGEHTLGPVEVTVRDVLGLAERSFTYPNEQSILVYPRIRTLDAGTRQALSGLPEFRLVSMRGEFDSLREYERGDALRDIHWKTSAKQPDEELTVKEYTDEDDLGSVELVAEAEGGRESADAMAEAAASLAAFLLEADLTVGVSAPAGVVEPGAGAYQRQQVLELLGRTGPGSVTDSERRAADVRVVGREDGSVAVHVDEEPVPFEPAAGEGRRRVADGGDG